MSELTFRKYLIGQVLTNLAHLDNYHIETKEQIADYAISLADTVISKMGSSFTRIGKMFRQGDVLIARINAIPPSALPAPYENEHAVLAHGEVTGHKHQLTQEEAQLFADNDNMFLRITTPVGYVRHEEHSPIALEQGDYQVIRQREGTDEDDAKAVRD